MNDADRRYWEKVARDSAELERETGRGTPLERARIMAWANKRRKEIGMPPLTDDELDDPPELEFYRIARARRLLQRPRTRPR